MARIEQSNVGGVRREPLLYQDSAQAAAKPDLEKRAAAGAGKDFSVARGARDKYWAPASSADLLLANPALPDSFEKRPDAREMAGLIKGIVERHSPRSATSEGERRLLLVLTDLVKAQDGILTRLAKMTKV